MPRVCVFDVDGVLLDVTRRVSVARTRAELRGRGFWEEFFSEELLELDTPRPAGVECLRRCLSRGLRIAVVTGRPSRLRGATLRQLELVGLRPPDLWRLLMRSDGDLRPGYEVKLELVGGVVEEVHDDDERFLGLLRQVLPEAKLYLHIGDSCVSYA